MSSGVGRGARFPSTSTHAPAGVEVSWMEKLPKCPTAMTTTAANSIAKSGAAAKSHCVGTRCIRLGYSTLWAGTLAEAGSEAADGRDFAEAGSEAADGRDLAF